MSELAARARIAAAQKMRWAKLWHKAGAPAKVVSYKWQAGALSSCAKEDRGGAEDAMGEGQGREDRG